MKTHEETSILLRMKIENLIESHALLPADLVKLIEPMAKSLRLRTLSNFAAENKLSYNGAKVRLKDRKSVIIDKVEFYITDEPC